MRKKILDDKFFMPKQYEVGTAEKDVSETETPYPLAKGSDGLPKFNELQDAQKKNMPKAMRSQVAFQQKKLQWSNYQIVNFLITPTDSVASQTYYNNEYNAATAVGTALQSSILFGTNSADVTRAKYYNIVYANVRLINLSSIGTESPSFIEFYPMQKVDSGISGGKIPKQIEAVTDPTGVVTFLTTGEEYGVQSFGVDVYNENAYYTQSPDLKGIRCCGLALKEIQMNFGSSVTLSSIRFNVEIGIDLTTEGNNY